MLKSVSTENAPAAIGPYSQAIIANGMVFTSGQIPIDPKTGELVNGDIKVQAKQSCENLKAVLDEAGAGLANVVKTTCFLADMGDFAAFNEVYAEYFSHKPARSCFAVKDLPKGALVEIETVAVL